MEQRPGDKEEVNMAVPTVMHRPFDAAAYLDDVQSQAAALSEALETGHKGIVLGIVNAIARARGMTALARDTGIKRETLYAALGEDGNPTIETFLTVISGLGLTLKAEANDATRGTDRQVA